MQDTAVIVWTIGHSTHSYERMHALLRDAGITAVADVRTSPHSRFNPQFNRGILKEELRADGIAYTFLGKELGGRPHDGRYYRNGIADYERMAKAPEFEKGIERVLEGAGKYRVALMCSEHDPLDCHRCLLVGRALAERGVTVRHILADGRVAEHVEIEKRLLSSEGHTGADLFVSPDEQLAKAYRERARKVAYTEQPESITPPTAAE